MAMIKCPECRHHISSMAKACPECGVPIDPVWAEEEAQRELEKLKDVPFTVEANGEEVEVSASQERVAASSAKSSATEDKHESGMAGRVLLVATVLLGLAIGGLYYYDYRSEQQREERAYELLQDCSNPDFFEDFIIRFPKSKHIGEVRERLKNVAVKQNEWQQLIANGSMEDLRQFVRQHPTSPYVKVAQLRIDSLDWEEARQANSMEAVTRYLTMHPEGYFIDDAEALRKKIERQRAEAEAAAAAALRDSVARAQATDSTTVAI